MGANYCPERLYMTLQTSALASSISLAEDPDATYEGLRSLAVVGDLKLYKLSVVRASVQGQRNLPIYYPNIVPNQTNPWLTTLSLTMKATYPGASSAVYTYTAPSATLNVAWQTTIWTATKEVFQRATLRMSDATPALQGTTTASWAAAIQSCYASLGSGGGIPTMTVAAVGNNLQFTAPLNMPQGWYFSVSPVTETGLGDPCPALGFAYNSTAEVSSLPQKDGATLTTLVLPYTCSYTYTAPAFQDGVYSTTRSLIWEPQTTDVVTPPVPIPAQDPNNVAYYMYDYSWFVRLLNKTLANAWTDVRDNVPRGIVDQTPPTVSYVPSRQSFTLTVPGMYIDGTRTAFEETTLDLEITLNEELANLVAWPATYLSNGAATLIWDNATTTGSIDSYRTITSDYPATANAWSPIQSLVFLTSTLPTRAEIVSPATFKGTTGAPVISSNDTAQILTDVVPAFSDAADWDANIILYSPTVLRWIDLNDQTGGLNNLTFSMGWRNAYTGAVYPLKMNPTCSFNVKLLFQRRDIPF